MVFSGSPRGEAGVPEDGSGRSPPPALDFGLTAVTALQPSDFKLRYPLNIIFLQRIKS